MADLTPEQQAVIEAARARMANGGLNAQQQAAIEAARARLAAQLPAPQEPQGWSGSVGTQQPERTIGDAIMDNLVGRDDGVQSVGETIGTTINNGIESLTYGIIGDEAAAGADALLGRGTYDDRLQVYRDNEEQLRENNPVAYWGSEIAPAMVAPGAAIKAGGGLLSRVLTSAGVGGAGGGLFGVTEAEGDLQDRAAGGANGLALGAGVGAALPVLGAVLGRAISPMRNSDAQRRGLVEVLDDAGVGGMTAGQRTGSETLQRLEGRLMPTSDQMDDFSRAVMRTLGSADDRATPEALDAAQRRITGVMNDVMDGVEVRPNQAMAEAAEEIAADYALDTAEGAMVPRIRNIVEEIVDRATSPDGEAIPLNILRKWRTRLGAMTQGSDEAVRTAAAGLRSIIDDASEEALQAAGRAGDIARLGEARVQYRNLLAVSRAMSGAGVDTQVGIVSPQALRTATAITQGRNNYAMGRGTDLMELSRAGAGVLAPLPSVMAGGQRMLPQMSQAVGLSGGGALGYQVAGVPGAVAGATAGILGPMVGSAMLRSRPVAAALSNRLAPNANSLDAPLRRGLLGALAGGDHPQVLP